MPDLGGTNLRGAPGTGTVSAARGSAGGQKSVSESPDDIVLPPPDMSRLFAIGRENARANAARANAPVASATPPALQKVTPTAQAPVATKKVDVRNLSTDDLTRLRQHSQNKINQAQNETESARHRLNASRIDTEIARRNSRVTEARSGGLGVRPGSGLFSRIAGAIGDRLAPRTTQALVDRARRLGKEASNPRTDQALARKHILWLRTALHNKSPAVQDAAKSALRRIEVVHA